VDEESILFLVTELEKEMVCMECDGDIDRFKYYGTQIYAMSEGGIPIEEIVCLACFSI